jgi:hypothetical protein
MKFLKALLIFIRMYRDGFYFSENSHEDPNGTRWGFYRFNHVGQPGMFDIDYSFDVADRDGYAHIHGDDYRLTFDNRGKLTRSVESKTSIDNNPLYYV